MGDLLRNLQHELKSVKDENQELKTEVGLLRGYVAAIESLIDAIDELDPKAEIMPLLDRILYNAMAVTNSKDGSLMVVDDEKDELAFVYARGDVSTEKLAGQRLPIGKGIAGWVAKNGKPAIVANARADPRFFAGIDDAYKFTTNSLMAVPIIGKGQVLGVIEVLNKTNGTVYNQTDQILLTLLCRFAGDVLHTMAHQGEEKPAA